MTRPISFLRPSLIAAAALALAGGAVAQPVDSARAKAMLFGDAAPQVQIHRQDFLSADDGKIVAQIAQTLTYYAAIAAAPAEGLASEASVAQTNFHGIDAARRAAVTACNARRTVSGPGCVVVASILPKGYAPQPVQLSAQATRFFGEDFARIKGPKAFAISSATGSWATGQGARATADALAACNKRAREEGAADCQVVIEDK